MNISMNHPCWLNVRVSVDFKVSFCVNKGRISEVLSILEELYRNIKRIIDSI